MANGISLTNRSITAIKGQAAFLPNQPLIHNCVAQPTLAENTYLAPGDIVTFDATNTLPGLTVIKKAAVTDTPCGVIVYSPVKTGYKANDRVTIYPVNSFVYLPAGAATIKNGDKLQFNANGQVVKTTTAQNGYIGTAWTTAAAINDLIAVQIVPGMEPAASS